MWQASCTPHHITLTVPRGAEARQALQGLVAHGQPALPSLGGKLPPRPPPLLVALGSTATGWKSKGRKELEMGGSTAWSQCLC